MIDYSNKFCAQCGGATHQIIPEGDHVKRDVCKKCEHIHYVNPKVIVGSLPVHGDKVLMCKRDIQPRLGYWTLPAGFMEANETTEQGAARETWEESEAKLKNMELYALFDLPYISQLYVMYRSELANDHFAPTNESSEVRLFSESEIPWDDIAFPIIVQVLRDYFNDRKTGVFKPQHHVWPQRPISAELKPVR